MSSAPPFRDSTASVLLDALRAGAAFMVVLGHWRSALFVDFAEVHSHRSLLAPVYLLSGAAQEAVLLFFALSGYLIAGSILEAWRRGAWSWRKYWTHRLVRLWIVLLPALLAGALWDRWGIHLGAAPALYAGDDAHGLTRNVATALSWRGLLGNAAFLQTILVPPFGSNVALWSLASEFWYYALFPLLVCIARAFMRPAAQTLACAAALGAVVFLLRDNAFVLPLFPVWLMGALLHALPRKVTTARERAGATAAFALLLLFTPLIRPTYLIGNLKVGDLTFGAGTAAYLWILLGASRPARPSWPNRLARWSAGFSYTLYAVHTPPLIFAAAFLVHDSRWMPDGTKALIATGLLILIIAYAWLLGLVTEARTDQVRTRVERLIS
ncbi:MAG TPA: acyltransferase [Steroidobacteraceae bacterium]|nr:acyltransferase [Steroidobacteraceae bacterium]